MGTIHLDLFSTLDLVAQAPGGPDEDRSNGFPYGGWQAPFFDDDAGSEVMAGMEGMDALLLGRRTYDIFAGYWPHQEDGQDGSIATLFNRIPKYVASRGTPSMDWTGSSLLGPDPVSAVRDVRDRHQKVHVIGSLDFAQTLLRERLVDRLNLWLFPVVLGTGKKVFDGGAVPTNLRLTEPAITSSTGAVLLRYGVLEGEPAAGDMTVSDRGV